MEKNQARFFKKTFRNSVFTIAKVLGRQRRYLGDPTDALARHVDHLLNDDKKDMSIDHKYDLYDFDLFELLK